MFVILLLSGFLPSMSFFRNQPDQLLFFMFVLLSVRMFDFAHSDFYLQCDSSPKKLLICYCMLVADSSLKNRFQDTI